MLPVGAFAFMSETHVWVGQQVVNDLLEPGDGYGKLSIPPVGEFEVDPLIVNAIERHRKVYLMGHIGPDGFPDLVAGQVTTHPGVEGGWNTDDWFDHVLRMGDDPKEIAFKYGYVAHGAADFWAHTYVNTYSGGTFDIFDNGIEEEVRHILLEGFIAQYTPPLIDQNGHDLGAFYQNVATGSELPLEAIARTLVTHVDAQAEYARTPAASYMNAAVNIGDIVDGYISRVEGWRSPVDEALESVASEVLRLEQEIDDILSDPTVNYGLVCEVVEKCEKECNPILFGLACKTVCKVVDEVCHENNTLGALRKELAPLRDYQYALFATRPEVEVLYQALLDWREGIRVAIREYQGASSRVVAELMKPDGDPAQELKDWVACYGLTLAGVNTMFVGTTSVTWKAGCKLYKTYVDVVDTIDALQSDYGSVLFGLLGNEVYNVKNKVLEDFERRLGEEFISKVAGEEALDIIRHYEGAKGGDVANLMADAFSSAGNNNLLKIADIKSRVESEMHIANGHFDPEQYAVAYNSVVLAKLTLLSSGELNRMVDEHGGHSGLYGSYLFDDRQPFNILLGGVKTIDGNHQWLAVAPPYLREGGWSSPQNVTSGYRASEGKGFRLFQDPKARRNIFQLIFKGALVPGIELPHQIGKRDVKPGGYPYSVCHSNYYPNGTGDKTCILEYLVPIMHNLLN